MKTALIHLFLCAVLLVKAQSASILKGEEFEHPKKYRYMHPVEGDEGAQYFMESEYASMEGGCLFYKISSVNGKLLFKQELEFEKREEFIAAYNKNGNILLFTKLKDKKEDQMYLLLREYDAKTGTALGNTKVVSKLSLREEGSYERNFAISFSPNDKKMLVVTEERGKKTAPDVVARLFELEGFKNIWEKKAVTVFENSPVYTFNYIVSNDGVFAYLFAFFRSNSPTDVSFGIGLIPLNNYQNQMIRLPAAGRTLYTPNLEYVEDNLICSGEYFEGEDRNKKSKEITDMGFFFLTVDLNTAEIRTQSFDPLSEEFKNLLTYRDPSPYYAVTGVNSTSYSHKNYLHYQTVLMNGSFYVIRHHSYVLLINGIPTTTNRELLITKYNNGRKMEWNRLIPRSSYCMGEINQQLNLVCARKINLIYYDHPKNQAVTLKDYNGKKYKMQTKPDEKSLVFASIDEAGNIQKHSIATETTFFLSSDFEKNFTGAENKVTGRSDTESKKTRRYDVITIND